VTHQCSTRMFAARYKLQVITDLTQSYSISVLRTLTKMFYITCAPIITAGKPVSTAFWVSVLSATRSSSGEESNKLCLPLLWLLFFFFFFVCLFCFVLFCFSLLFLAAPDVIASCWGTKGRGWLPWARSSDLVHCPPWELSG